MTTDTVSWYITFGLGTPYGRQFSEILVPAGLDKWNEAEPLARSAAVSAYGTAWAFLYPPEKFDESIGRYNLTRRDLIDSRVSL